MTEKNRGKKTNTWKKTAIIYLEFYLIFMLDTRAELKSSLYANLLKIMYNTQCCIRE